jgi:bifunctional DNase/RNase
MNCGAQNEQNKESGDSMIQMFVTSIALDKRSGEPIVLLNDANNNCALPIWIGAAEARAITIAVQKIPTSRPLTHDLLHSVIKRLGYTVKEIRINELKNNTYKALIVLARGKGKVRKSIITMDARPSDAIALSAIADAPLMVAKEIIHRSNVLVITASEDDRKEKEKFREFLQDIKASDFKLPDATEIKPDESDSNEENTDKSSESD